MEKNEITKNNELIAEFMEYDKKSYLTKNDYLYHSSWDWLMPVVEKIENHRVSFSINYTHCNLGYNNGKEEIHTSDKTKIKAVYKAVVEFIKWYNKSIGSY